MSFLHNAGTVARYEAVILRRSWFFRLFAIGSLLILIPMNIALFSPVGEQPWDFISISATLPLVNLYLLNIGQAIVVIFLAADFLKRDKKLDTNEVLYTRSISNLEYITGKTWGILRLFLGLNLIVLAVALTINIIQNNMKVDALAYIEYILILTIPTITFSLGFAFLLMTLIRNQALTFMILLGIAALDMFWLWYRAGSVFDYMAFGLPVFKSDVTGFENPGQIISQRLMFFSMGVAFIMLTVLLFNRLPQSKLQTSLTVIIMTVSFIASGYFTYKSYAMHRHNLTTKEKIINTNLRFENSLFPVITKADIELFHKENTIEATAKITLKNENPDTLRNYLFSLNPALKVNQVTSKGIKLKYSSINHVIEISPETPLNTGMTDIITIEYSGSIDEAYCYPSCSSNLKDNINRKAMLTLRKRQHFLDDDYVLLTPETHWYPVAGLNHYPSNPARIEIDFTLYSLVVKSDNGLIAVSQGKRIYDGKEYRFVPENPLTGLTVAMGNYLSDTLIVDSVSYITHYFPDNDYYKKDLAGLKDTLPHLISGIMRDLETSFSSGYPFKTLSIVEVPVHFFSLTRQSTQTRSEIQPSMILVHEKLSTLENAGFGVRFREQKKRMARNNQVITDKELEIRLLNNFLRENFISGTNTIFSRDSRSETVYSEPSRYRLGPSFYFYRNNFHSAEYPVINAAFESHLQHILFQGPRSGFMSNLGALSETDKANLVLKTISFRDLLAKNPKGDTVRVALGVKADWLFNLLRSQTGIKEFNNWFSEYCEENEFRSIDIKRLREDIRNKFGFDFYPYLDEWYLSLEQPGFIISGMTVNEIVVEERSRYEVIFTASNTGSVAGVFNISFRTEGQGGMGRQARRSADGEGPGEPGRMLIQGRGMNPDNIEKIILLGPEETRRISLVTDLQPRAVIINTIFSRNIPGEIIFPVTEINKKRRNKSTGDVNNITTLVPENDERELIVDNEDPGFSSGAEAAVAPLKKMFGITNRNRNTYMQIRQWNLPEHWQPVVSTTYHGRFVRSAVYTRAGTGEIEITWKTALPSPGYYDVYCYAGKRYRRLSSGSARVPGQGGQDNNPGDDMRGEQDDQDFKDFHYRIYHDGGIEELTFDYENAVAGWNNLGRFYYSSDSATVALTNKSSGKLVIGDAIKWVKIE